MLNSYDAQNSIVVATQGCLGTPNTISVADNPWHTQAGSDKRTSRGIIEFRLHLLGYSDFYRPLSIFYIPAQ